MDEITIAIISALAAGAKKIGEKTVVAGYDALKKLLKKKFGEKSDVAEATAKLEERPESEARQKMLAEEVEYVKADKDPEILEAAAKPLISNIQIISDVGDAVRYAISTSGPEDAVCIAGSLYVVGEAKVALDESGESLFQV